MIEIGTVLKNKLTGQHYVVTMMNGNVLETVGHDGIEVSIPKVSLDSFEVYDSILDVLPVPLATPSALDTQHGGNHYKKLGDYQPWQVLRVPS